MTRRPGFSLVVVLTLTLGIGVNVSIFSFVNGLLLRPLPYAEPSRLVQLSETAPDLGTMDVSLPDFHRWSSRTEVFDGMFAFDDEGFVLSEIDRPAVIQGATVTPGFLDVLGVTPMLGRGFTAAEGRPGSDSVALLSHAAWQTTFGGTRDLVGSTILLDGRRRTVVGIVPPGFHFPEVADVWVPLAFDPSTADPEAYGYDVIARLRPGRSIGEASEEGARITDELARLHPDTKSGLGVAVYPLRFADVPLSLTLAALILLGAVCLVLLVACANVANLLLARGEDRVRELVLRRALGASRFRLVTQSMSESVVLAIVGGVGALAVAAGAVRVFPSLLPDEVPFWLAFELDWRVLAWTGWVAMFACVAMGLLPAWRTSSATVANSARFSRDRGRKVLVAVEVTLATVLLLDAGLLLRGLESLRSTDPGIETERVLVMSALGAPGTEGTREGIQREIADRVEALPGVVAVAATTNVPLLGGPDQVAIEADGGRSGEARRSVGGLTAVSEGYFRTLGIPLIAGRTFTPEEVWTGSRSAVVSRSLAERLWPDADPLGRRARHGALGTRSPTVADQQPWLTVIGVVGDVREDSLGRPPSESIYVPYGGLANAGVTLIALTAGEPLAMVGALREQIEAADPGLALLEPTTMDEALRHATWTERLATRLLSAFSILALLLAALGIYGVMSLITTRRSRELGVRMALGADAGSLSRMVVGEAARVIGLGLVLGLVAGIVSARSLSALLHGVEPLDPPALIGATAVLAAAGALAAYLPARRAAATDPASALESES